jgi:ribose-phosphate pyrophosphokinase
VKPILFALDGHEAMADQLCRAHGLEPGGIDRRRFPDGESYLRLETAVSGREVILLYSLERPDEKALPLIFAADAARAQGAIRVGLIAPYLAYMRQDRAFREGEAITSISFARLVSAAFDWLITVDPHLHRHPRLDSIYSIPAIAVSAAKPIADWLRANVPSPMLIGPDAESSQWVDHIAALAGTPSAILRKRRQGDLDVVIDGPELEVPATRTPVVIDDIISSAGTMIEAVKLVRQRVRRDPICVGVHALFAGDALERLSQAGTARIVTSNTIPHATNAIDVGAEIGAALTTMLSRSPN